MEFFYNLKIKLVLTIRRRGFALKLETRTGFPKLYEILKNGKNFHWLVMVRFLYSPNPVWPTQNRPVVGYIVFFPFSLTKEYCYWIKVNKTILYCIFTSISSPRRYSHVRSKNLVKKEVNLAFILICIVFVFIFSNIPRVFLNCYEFFMSEDMLRLDQISP